MFREEKKYWHNGKLKSFSIYKNDILYGEQKRYYYNGKLTYNWKFKNGLRHGEQKNCRFNGKLWTHYIRFKNNAEGISISYSENIGI